MVEFCSCRCDASPVISASQRRQTPTLRCRIVFGDRHCSIDAAPKANIGTRRSSGYFESESVVIARQLRAGSRPVSTARTEFLTRNVINLSGFGLNKAE